MLMDAGENSSTEAVVSVDVFPNAIQAVNGRILEVLSQHLLTEHICLDPDDNPIEIIITRRSLLAQGIIEILREFSVIDPTSKFLEGARIVFWQPDYTFQAFSHLCI